MFASSHAFPSPKALCALLVKGGATAAVLIAAVPVVGACGGSSISCKKFDATLCGNETIKVTACGKADSADALNAQNLILSVDNPPYYLDVSPANASKLPTIPDNVKLDISVQTDPGGSPFSPSNNLKSGTLHTEAYGSPTAGNPYDDAAGVVTWSELGTRTASGILIAPRVVITSAHALLKDQAGAGTDHYEAPEGYGDDLSQRIITFKSFKLSGKIGWKSQTGWGFVNPNYDPLTRSFDVGIVVLTDPVPDITTFVTLKATDAIDQTCTCPLNPTPGARVVGYGESGLNGDEPPEVPKNLTDFDFPVKAGQIRRSLLAEIESRDTLKDSSGYATPSINLITEGLFRGDSGAPVLGVEGDGTPYLLGVYSGPSSCESRMATRMSQSIVDWIVGSLTKGDLYSHPPLNWAGLNGGSPDDSKYDFVPPSTWPTTPIAIHRGSQLPGEVQAESGAGRLRPQTSGDLVGVDPGGMTCQPPPAPAPKVDIGSFDRIVILGDSLSDIKNQYSYHLSSWTPTPNNGYWHGRFTNGFNWIDYFGLDNGFQLDDAKILNPSVGGSFASQAGQNIVSKVTWPARPTMLKEYNDLNLSDDAHKNTLFIIWSGPNDINSGANSQPKMPNSSLPMTGNWLGRQVVKDIASLTDTLLKKGAPRVLIFNVPPLDLVPVATQPNAAGGGYAGSPSKLLFAKTGVETINADLAAWAEGKSEETGGKVSVLDDWQFIRDGIVKDDTGYVPRISINLYQNANGCQNIAADTGSWNPSQSYKDSRCPGYMFFDNLHPTTFAHCGLNQNFQRQMNDIGVTVKYPSGGDLESWCRKVQQNDTWTDGPGGYSTPRTVRFYMEHIGGFSSDDSAKTTCPSLCPDGFVWQSDSTKDTTTLPNWFDIDTIPGGLPQPGTDGQTLAPGWTRPPSGALQSLGACLCMPSAGP